MSGVCEWPSFLVRYLQNLKEVFLKFRFGDGDPGQLKKQTDHLNFFSLPLAVVP